MTTIEKLQYTAKPRTTSAAVKVQSM